MSPSEDPPFPAAGRAKIGQTTIPELPAAVSLPGDEEGPVFREPWEARAFAIVVSLHGQGRFAWADWTTYLAAEIARNRNENDPRSYYECWLAACEKLLADRNLVTPGDAKLFHDHDHGQEDDPAVR